MKEEVFRLVAPDNVIRYEGGPLKVLLVDAGAKDNIVRSLLKRGATVVRAPWHTDLAPLAAECDGIIIGNGPGDPKDLMPLVAQVRSLLSSYRKPIFGICLGNQILALAAGGDTYKLPYGHRGVNQPVQDLLTRRCYITSQNHGYAVRRGLAPRRLGAVVRQRERRHQRGHPRPHPPVLQRAVPPRGLPRTRGHGLPLRRLPAPRRRDGEGVTMYGAYLPRKPRKVLVLGSGALQIGQAGEFDYSGTQAIKALKEEGIATVLVNPNIATIQTSEGLADKHLPHRGHARSSSSGSWSRRRSTRILLSFGGQTALNCGLALDEARRPRQVRRAGAGHAGQDHPRHRGPQALHRAARRDRRKPPRAAAPAAPPTRRGPRPARSASR